MPTIEPGVAIGTAQYDSIDALVKLFRDALAGLQQIEQQLREGTFRRSFIQARIREANRIIESLLAYRDGIATGAVVDWVRENLPATYQYGAGRAVRDLGEQIATVAGGQQQIHVRAVAALVDRFMTDTTQVIVQLHANTIRASRLILEQAGFTTEIAQGVIGGLPRRQVSRELVASFRRAVQGALPRGAAIDLTHVEINGRSFRLDYWAELHARTELARASTAGTRVLAAMNDVRHVQITTHAHAPCICTPFEGRIYALDQGDPVFPWIGTVPNGGVPLHPNCVHREVPAVIELLEERDEIRGHVRIPKDFAGLDTREIARLVRENREQLRPYAESRTRFLPEDFRLSTRRAA